jgi:hypothetical protein
MRWPVLVLVGTLLVLAGCSRPASTDRVEDDPPDPAVEAHLEWALDVDGEVQGAGVALDELLASREGTPAWRARVAEALGVWEGAYADALRCRPPSQLARGHGQLLRGLGEYVLAADLIRLGLASGDDDLLAQGLAHEQDGAAQLDAAVSLLRWGLEPDAPAS